LPHSHVDTLVIARINLKFAAVAVAVALAVAAPAAAQSLDDDNVDAASSRYDSPEVIQKIGSASRSRYSDGRRSTETKRGTHSRSSDCFDCQPRRHYDDQKVVKKVRNVDHSRVINTVTVVPAGRRTREYNRLVIRKNEIRNVGVVQHNHIIVEKEVRYVRRVPATTTVNFVTHNYRVIERPAAVTIPVGPRRDYECGVGLGRDQGSCRRSLYVRG
jgi:hypothetical protein